MYLITKSLYSQNNFWYQYWDKQKMMKFWRSICWNLLTKILKNTRDKKIINYWSKNTKVSKDKKIRRKLQFILIMKEIKSLILDIWNLMNWSFCFISIYQTALLNPNVSLDFYERKKVWYGVFYAQSSHTRSTKILDHAHFPCFMFTVIEIFSAFPITIRLNDTI